MPEEPQPQPDDPPHDSVRDVEYKGEPLDAARGPGLGCFRFQLVVLAVLIVLTPLSAMWQWPSWISAALLFALIGLLLISGQTIIFLLRLVAADRRAARLERRRPLASKSKTVGELEDDAAVGSPASDDAADVAPAADLAPAADGEPSDPTDPGGVRE